YAAWDATRVTSTAQQIVSLSHPHGDTMRFALGNLTHAYRIFGYSQDFYGVAFTRGIIEAGSSGSRLLAYQNSTPPPRGLLSGSTITNSATGMSCTDTSEEALYGRSELLYPEVAQYLSNSPQAPDDTPNRVLDWVGVPFDPVTEVPLDTRTTPLTFTDRHID